MKIIWERRLSAPIYNRSLARVGRKFITTSNRSLVVSVGKKNKNERYKRSGRYLTIYKLLRIREFCREPNSPEFLLHLRLSFALSLAFPLFLSTRRGTFLVDVNCLDTFDVLVLILELCGRASHSRLSFPTTNEFTRHHRCNPPRSPNREIFIFGTCFLKKNRGRGSQDNGNRPVLSNDSDKNFIRSRLEVIMINIRNTV